MYRWYNYAIESNEKQLQQIEVLLELLKYLSCKVHSCLICGFSVNPPYSIFKSVQLSTSPRYSHLFNVLYFMLMTGLHLLPFPINPPSFLKSYGTTSTFLPDLSLCTWLNYNLALPRGFRSFKWQLLFLQTCKTS